MTTATVEPTEQVTTEPGGEKTTLLAPASAAPTTATPEAIAAEKAATEKAAADKAVADKAAAEKAAAEAVPERYDLNLPEGSLLQTADVDRVKAEAKTLGLTQAEAQEYLDTQSKAVSTYHEAQVKQVDEIHRSWAKEAEADKEIGGDALKVNVEMGKRVIDRFDPTGKFKRILNASGLGNHVDTIRIFSAIGKAMTEDQLVHQGTHTTKPKSMEETFYPSSNTTTKE